MGVLSALGFSFKAIFVKLGFSHGVDPVTLLALRMAFSLPLFLIMAVWVGTAGITRSDWWQLALLGMLGYYLASLLDFLGLQYISAGLERLILFLYPTLVLIFSALFFKQAVTRRLLGALALCYLGITLAMAHDVRLAGAAEDVAKGSLLVFACTVTFAWYWMGASQLVPRLGALRLTAYASSFACIYSFAHFLITHPLAALQVPSVVYWDTLGLALFSTVLPIYFQAEAIRCIGVATASLVSTLGPVLTLGLSWLILGESLSIWQLVGASFVVAGVSVAGRQKC